MFFDFIYCGLQRRDGKRKFTIATTDRCGDKVDGDRVGESRGVDGDKHNVVVYGLRLIETDARSGRSGDIGTHGSVADEFVDRLGQRHQVGLQRLFVPLTTGGAHRVRVHGDD